MMSKKNWKEKIYKQYKVLKNEVAPNMPLTKSEAIAPSEKALAEDFVVEIVNPTKHAIKWRSKGY
ncbi:hypothetical protein [Vagococcus fessus]|nr:hypothetical protein [Vagococcus fessus]